MLVVEGLVKRFDAGTPDEKVAIAGIDLALQSGEFVAAIGGNGAGKSTLLNLIGGALSPDAGRVSIDGVDASSEPEHRRAQRVARVFQDPMVGTAASLTVEENLALAEMRSRGRGWRAALPPARRERFVQALATVGLGLERRLGDRAGSLSGGQRQALALVMATMNPPRLLLLDEHTAALDPRTSATVMQATVALVQRARLTTLMVTHNMEHALAHASRIVMLAEGRIRADLDAAAKAGLTVPDLVDRFRLADDRIVLGA